MSRSSAIAGAVLVGVLAGCGGGPSAPSPTPSPVSAAPSVASPTDGRPEPATTPVPQPGGGDVGSTVPPGKDVPAVRGKLDGQVRVSPDVTVSLSEVSGLTAKAKVPGEVTGPAVRMTVVLRNDANEPLDLSNLVVGAVGSDGAPGSEMSGKPAKPLGKSVAAGKTGEGVYVFTVPTNRRDPIEVSVGLSADVPVAVFRGPVG